MIIILTEGLENGRPFVSEVESEIRGEGIVVYCMLVTSNAADSLKTLGDQTGWCADKLMVVLL